MIVYRVPVDFQQSFSTTLHRKKISAFNLKEGKVGKERFCNIYTKEKIFKYIVLHV